MNKPHTLPLDQSQRGKYRHYKGGLYEVLHIVRHSETMEEQVVYVQLDKPTGWWTRPYDMFFGEVTVEGVAQPRFTKIDT
jgi:hypothetical protein